MNYQQASIDLHEEYKGKLSVQSVVPIVTQDDLATVYSPGVAEPCKVIAEDKSKANDLTIKGRTVAIVSDGSAVLGLGDIGPEAGLPVMEGKAALLKEFAGVDAFPLCIDTNDVDEIVRFVELIAPTFGGVNLEDISAPRCFEIESRLQDLGIPVFHDDQHGTAIVVLAGMINASKVLGKSISDMKIVVNGAGAGGVAVAKLLDTYSTSPKNIIMCDSKGVVSSDRDNLNDYKKDLLTWSNKEDLSGSLQDALVDADVFIGLSVAGALNTDWISTMAGSPIVFALANPVPEVIPEEAKEAGVAIIATGRSDYPNQVNNVLAFPGLFRGALDARLPRITEAMKVAAAEAIAGLVAEPSADMILPSPLDKSVVESVAEAVKNV